MLTNKVQGLNAQIEELTNLARVETEQQGLSKKVIIEGANGNSGGQGQAPQTNLDAIRVDYNMVIRENQMLEDD